MKKQLEAARRALDKVRTEAYHHGQHYETLSQCLAKAPDSVRARYQAALDKIAELEAEAVAKGRAYRASHGLVFYR